MNRDETWSKENYSSTLTSLREDYLGYTDNELYAIWCRDQKLIPIDNIDGKVLLDQWQIHATHDGRHAKVDGFKVSRPLYGRALKAAKGTSKPTYVRRKKVEMQAVRGQQNPNAGSFGGAGISEQAMSLASRFDEAKRKVNEVREPFRQLEMFRMRMQDMGKTVLAEIASTDMEAREIFDSLGLLGARPRD